MLHCDDDDLALIALGEQADEQDRAHLASCARCRSRLDELTATVATVRSIGPDDVPVSPPAAVWAAISDELGLGSPADASETTSVAPAVDLAAERERRRPTRVRIWAAAGAAAVVGLLAGVVATAAVLSGPSTGEVVASAQLAPIDGSGLAGSATVSRDGDAKVLTVDVPDLPAQSDAYYEVWMATPDTSTMVAIGTLNPGETGRFTLPAGMDASAFPVVDVSVEHFDGDAGHSATSVARGTLGA